jgi:hypothetical protein
VFGWREWNFSFCPTTWKLRSVWVEGIFVTCLANLIFFDKINNSEKCLYPYILLLLKNKEEIHHQKHDMEHSFCHMFYYPESYQHFINPALNFTHSLAPIYQSHSFLILQGSV